MQHLSQEFVSQALFSSIDSLLEHRDVFLNNPKSDFTRTKKISFEKTILFPMVAGSDDVANEILDLFGEDGMSLPSSIIQRRNQIKASAFMELFHHFTNKIPLSKTINGYLIACMDGSRLNLPYNPSDSFTFCNCIHGRKGINQVHLNLLYDPLNDVFLDLEIQGIHEMDEISAFSHLLDSQAQKGAPLNTIYLADRGYASYNVFAHAIHNNQLFLIRVPKPFAEGLCSSDPHWLEGDRFDKEIYVHVGRRRTKKNQQLQNYHCIPSRRNYDYLKEGSDQTECLKLRVLKFPISEDTYEYIVTNLPQYAFSLPTIKELYHLRWNEETAFRYLKYAGNMVRLHSRKWNFLIQEIYAKLVMYNFTSFLMAAVDSKVKKTIKHAYVINHTQAQKLSISFLKGKVKKVLDLMQKFLVPVRSGRRFERNLRSQSADTLQYR